MYTDLQINPNICKSNLIQIKLFITVFKSIAPAHSVIAIKMSISSHSSIYMITFLQLSHICFPLIYLDATTTTAMTPSVSGKK